MNRIDGRPSIKSDAKIGPKVLVLMPVYNGTNFLEEQMASILQQEGVDLKVIALDDSSSDNSFAILKYLAAKDCRVVAIKNKKNLGLIGSISVLLGLAEKEDSTFVSLADQDDVWDKNKLIRSIQKLNADEANIVYSNVRIIDYSGLPTSSDYFKDRKIQPIKSQNLLPFALRNPAIGHTMVFRSDLLSALKEIPDYLPIHEIWFICISSQTGSITYIDSPLGSYRQHSNNVTGANEGSFLKKIFRKNFIPMLRKRKANRYYAIKTLARFDGDYENVVKMMESSFLKKLVLWPMFGMSVFKNSSEIGLQHCITEILLFVLPPYIKSSYR